MISKEVKHLRIRPFVVTGVFGNQFVRLFEAPRDCDAVIFSNNEELSAEAEQKGWTFVLAKSGPLGMSSDERVSALQSKYVKFMQFMEDFPEYQSDGPVTYIDHKVKITREHLEWMSGLVQSGRSILLRNTPTVKTTLSDEIAAAMPQERYSVMMTQTAMWIAEMKRTRGIKESVRIMNTGLIHYVDIPSIRPLLDEVFRTTWSLGQPECQIIWAALMQPYEALVQRVAWSEIGIDHANP